MATRNSTRFAALSFLSLLIALSSVALPAAAQTELKTKQVGKFANVFVITVDTKGKARHLIVDTGAASSVFSRDTYGAGVNVIRHDKISSVSGDADMQEIFVDMTIGEKRIQTRAFMADLTNVSRAAGMTIDGILGQDVLSTFSRVTFDYKHKTIIFEP